MSLRIYHFIIIWLQSACPLQARHQGGSMSPRVSTPMTNASSPAPWRFWPIHWQKLMCQWFWRYLLMVYYAFIMHTFGRISHFANVSYNSCGMSSINSRQYVWIWTFVSKVTYKPIFDFLHIFPLRCVPGFCTSFGIWCSGSYFCAVAARLVALPLALMLWRSQPPSPVALDCLGVYLDDFWKIFLQLLQNLFCFYLCVI